MPDLSDGETAEMKGSGAKPYLLKNSGGVYSCSCPAWRNQSTPIERRTCKHLRKYRGDEAEEARLGAALPQKPAATEGGAPAPPPLLLAETWDTAADLSGWWMSEKLDGLRAYWDGRQFISRLGNLFHTPDWFCAGLPNVPLDGELWVGRGQFARASGLVRRQDKTELWKEVRYLVFDAPAAPGGFEERLQFVRNSLARSNPPPYAAAHHHELCRGLDHLRAELARVESLGGEGLMLRQPGSRYEAGRSPTLVKVKTFKDAEAVVVGHQPGKGRHKGRVGALLVRLASGAECAVGTGLSDAERSDPPPVGSVVTFRYQELSEAGVPRFPSYVGVRIDAAPVPAPTPMARPIDPAVDKSVRESWERIERWLAEHAPPVAAKLGGPATPEAIAKAEATLGVRLPDDVRASYAVHDGSGGAWLFPSGDYLSLGEMLEQYAVWKELVEGGDFDGEESNPVGPIRRDHYNLKWVPLTHNGGGDHTLIDLAPAKGGRVGQLIEFSHETGPERVIAPGLAEYLAVIAAALESGAARPEGDELDWPAGEPSETSTPLPQPQENEMSAKRYFEFSEGTSNKFWEVSHEGTEMTTRYGKIGADGKATTKSYATPEKAAEEAAKITAKKVKEGYVEKTK